MDNQPHPVTMPTTKKRILVVDDEASFTRLLKLNLEQTEDYEVLVENSPEHAVAAARRFKPDLALLDVMMPEMDGGTLATSLRACASLERLPIVFLTAAVKKEEVASHRGQIGGFPFIAKPVDLGELIDAINAHLPKSQPTGPSVQPPQP
jgi:DNA-binding response OmpR family regulator